jgi:membrane protein implicated in regulation of membrane protease activity
MTRLIVAMGWSYVVVLMAAAQDGWLAALGTLVFYGLLPLAVVLYLLGAPARAKRLRAATAEERRAAAASASSPDSASDPD